MTDLMLLTEDGSVSVSTLQLKPTDVLCFKFPSSWTAPMVWKMMNTIQQMTYEGGVLAGVKVMFLQGDVEINVLEMQQQ